LANLSRTLKPCSRLFSSFRFTLLAASALAILTCACAPAVTAQELPWQPVGPPGGDVLSLAATANNSIYLGAADGHVFISHDAGQHWLLRGRVSSRRDAVIQKLLVDSQNSDRLLAAVWFQEVREGGGLYASSDGGATWVLSGLRGEIVRSVEQSAIAPEIFVAGTRSGIFRSADTARSWQRISPEADAELRNVDSLAIDPRDPQVIYAGTYHLPWKTSDGGKTWFPVAAGMIDDSDVMSLRIDAANPARIFASACSGIYRSENAAAAWTKLQGIPYSSRRTPAIVQDPGDPRVLYAATTEGLWLTRDGGESWMRVTPRDWIVNAVVVLPRAGASNTVLLGTEAQGVLVSSDGAATFAPANDGFSHRVAAALARDAQPPEQLLAWMPGSPDPLLATRDGGAHWQALPGRAPADVVRIFSSSAGWWLASASAGLLSYDESTATWNRLRFVAASAPTRRAPRSRQTPRAARKEIAPPIPATADISAVLTVGARVFVATPQALWSGTMGGKILRPLAISAAAIDLASEDFSSEVLWMVAAGYALSSRDDGKSWTPAALHMNSNAPAVDAPASSIDGEEIRWISAAPVSPDALEHTPRLLLMGTANGLYRRSSLQATWQLVQNGLPASEPLAYSFQNGVWVVAMRSGGLYLSRDASQTWERLETGPAAGPFTGVASTADGSLVAASLTEGLLRSSVALVPAVEPRKPN
jgi:photosystem II stability/assembly factor-like uncharacterized protein